MKEVRMKLPIGYDNFRELIDNQFDFVDKSLFIKEVIDDTAKVILITRPRRFGKTLNMSMLQHFFANSIQGVTTAGLFNDLKIATLPEYIKYQGQYPVIFISFKDIKKDNFDQAYDKIYELLIEVYSKYPEVMESDKLQSREKELCRLLLSRLATGVQLEDALKTLTTCIFQHYGTKPLILIDEYDTPIQSAYMNDYYESMISFMRNFLSAALKGNPYLHKAVLTGILRVSKESLFSDLNNLKVYSLLHSCYSEYFGFTETEVDNLLQLTHLQGQQDDIRNWFNGYQFGNSTIYNPWSIINCLFEGGKLQPYWVNTGGHDLIKRLLIQSRGPFKEKFEVLMQNKSIEVFLDEHLVFQYLENNETSMWNLLLAAGYLKIVTTEQRSQGLWAYVQIPNFEIRSIYQRIVEQWLSDGYGIEWYNHFLNYLLQGEIEKFSEKLQEFLVGIVSNQDTARFPEAFFHGLMLGFAASLDPKQYILKSNREAGYGRYDIAIIPKDQTKLGILLECKAAKKRAELTKKAKEALLQINTKQYEVEFQQYGIKQILKLGLALWGKELRIQYEKGYQDA